MPIPNNSTLRNVSEKIVEVVLGAGGGGATDFRRYICLGEKDEDTGLMGELKEMFGVSAPVPHGVWSSSRSDW